MPIMELFKNKQRKYCYIILQFIKENIKIHIYIYIF